MRPTLAPRDARDRLIVALDVASPEEAQRLVTRIGEAARFYKIGMQLVFAGGLTLIPPLVASGARVFLDMKLLDIDNTITGGVASIARLGVTFTTLHAYPKAMRAGVSARGDGGLRLLGVTVLTSMDDTDLADAGYAVGAATLAERRADDALAAGMDGIVCSPREAARVRKIVGPDMAIVTPGIRAADSAGDDQKRTMSARAAIAAGADYLVVGRPIIGAPDPAEAARKIVAEIEAALKERTGC